MQDPLSTLNDDQRQVAQTTEGPLLVLAGAGSGKTRALTHRIAYMLSKGLAHPSEILAVTFTNKAAQEMRHRIQDLVGSSALTPHHVSTFHGLGVRMLREQVGYHPRSRHFMIFDASDSERLVRQALKEQNVSLREWSPRVVRQVISSSKTVGTSAAEMLAAVQTERDDIIAKAYKRYEELLASHDAYDFDDLLIAPLRLLQNEASIRTKYQNQWKYVSVDEYQDTSPLQEELLRLLLRSDQNICAVGDDYQAIYSWRGAKVDHILSFERHYPNCTTIYLTQNYRSTPQILEAANEIISHNLAQKHKTLWTDGSAGDAVSLVQLMNDRAEVQHIRQQIESYLQEGGKMADCAVLYRTNAQSRLLEEEFLTHRIPYTIVGGFRFYDRREIKDAVSFLHMWVNPDSRLAVERIITTMLARIGPKTVERWHAAAQLSATPLIQYLHQTQAENRPALQKITATYHYTKARQYETVADLLRDLLNKSGYMDYIKEEDNSEERLENLEELFHVASAYDDPNVFLEDAALLSDIDTLEESSDRITCMTLHASKGLEFPVVFLVGLEEGLLPHINSFDSAAKIEEERRLMYVGMTRARKRLQITYASSRYRAGELVPQMPSRFLEHLPASVHKQTSSYTSHEEYQPDVGGIADFLHARSTPREAVAISIQTGNLIRHAQFGRGVVIDIQGSTVSCIFERHGVKTVSHDTLQAQAP